MSFQISNLVIDGLKSLNTTINTESTKKLISNTIKNTLSSDVSIKTPQIYGSKPDYSKQAEFSIATLFFLSVKHNYDSQQLKQILETNGVSSLTIQEICKQYEFNKTDLANHCVKYGFSLPHITEVDWKLTCDIKSSSIENSDNELNFNINFGRLNDGTGERETIVEFICNPEELQSLINKFKDIERHCEKISLNK